METSAANQLPQVDALPDGFLESSNEPLVIPTPDGDAAVLTNSSEGASTVLLDIPDCGSLDSQSMQDCIEATEKMQPRDSLSAIDEVPVFESPPSVEVSPQNTSENLNSIKIVPEVKDVKQKSVKRAAKSEKEFLEFTLRYQQVLAERDSAITVRDRLESLCRELQRQNKMLMDECKRVAAEGQNLRLDLSTKFQDAIKGVSVKLDEQKEECITQLKENEMLRNKLKQLCDQYTLAEQQFSQKLKQRELELQLADLKLKQQEEKAIHQQSQMKLYAEQVSQLLTTEKSLRTQLTADGEKFQQFQEALVKSNEVFETFKQEIEKMAKSIKELKKENTFLKGKCEKTDVTLIQLVEEREHMKKLLEKTKKQKEKLETLCRSLQAERKNNSSGINSSEFPTQ